MQRHLSAVHSKWIDGIFQCVKEFCSPARACRCANAKIPGMPTALRSGPYRFYFYSHEPSEPAHIHIDRDDLSAKFWLDPVQLAGNFGFRAHELRAIQSLVERHREMLLEAWDGFFGT